MPETSSEETPWAVCEELTPDKAHARMDDSAVDVFEAQDGRFFRAFVIGRDEQGLEKQKGAPLPAHLTVITDPSVIVPMMEYFSRRFAGASEGRENQPSA